MYPFGGLSAYLPYYYSNIDPLGLNGVIAVKKSMYEIRLNNCYRNVDF